MSIDIACRNCGRVIYAPEHAVGRDMTCPGCSKLVRVVRPRREGRPDEKPIAVACPTCDASIRLVPGLLGRRVYCNTCGTFLEVTLALRPIEKSDPATKNRPHPDSGHKEAHPNSEEPTFSHEEIPEETPPIKPPPLPEDMDYAAEPEDGEEPNVVQNDEVHHEDREDLVFGLPEIAEEPFPPSPSHGSPGEASQEAQAVSHTLSWHEEEHTTAVSDLDLEPPEFAEAPYPPSVPTSGFQQTNTQIQTESATDQAAVEQQDDQFHWAEGLELDLAETEVTPTRSSTDIPRSTPPPLTPHEATLALRDKEIGAALRLIQSGGYVPEVDEPNSADSTAVPDTRTATDQAPPWLWPSITAAAATCAMLAALYYILYVL